MRSANIKWHILQYVYLNRVNWLSCRSQLWDINLGSLSTPVSETRTATGSELISLLTYPHTTTFTLVSIFSPLKISSRKIWGTLRSKHATCSLPVAVRVLKTRVLKLPIILRLPSSGRKSFLAWKWKTLLSKRLINSCIKFPSQGNKLRGSVERTLIHTLAVNLQSLSLSLQKIQAYRYYRTNNGVPSRIVTIAE